MEVQSKILIMKVSRTLIVVGSLLLIISIVLTYKWISYNHAYPNEQTELTNSTKKANPLPKNSIDSKAKNKNHVQNSLAKKAVKSVANQPKFKSDKLFKRIPVILDVLDVLKSKKQPSRGQSIFFHETTNFRRIEKNAVVQLTAREACAIESAALHNPGLTVFVLFAGATHRPLRGDPLIRALHNYKNIRLRNLNLWRYAAGTPIAKWLKSGKLFKSKFLFPHVSDLLRYVTLYKYGGLYLDLDVVVQQNLEKLPPNFTGAESNISLACGVMKMSPGGLGHKIATMCLRDLEANYNANKWGTNGPGVITRVAKKQCNTDNIKSVINNPKHCNGFQIFDANAFYAISWRQWKYFFEPNRLNVTMKRISKSPVIHVWNKFSKGWKLKTKTNCAYTKLAKTHCPRSFAAAGEYF